MLKLLLDLIPVITFFITYKCANMHKATIIMMASNCVALYIYYVVYKRLSFILLISAGVLFVTGITSVILHDYKYVKMKPTIMYVMLAASLYISCIKKDPLVKNILSSIYKLDDKHWITLSRRCAHYCVLIAIANELTWRYCSESFWVHFKVFGIFPITVLFLLTQLPLILRNQKNTD